MGVDMWQLEKHLKKCEIQWIADHTEMAETISWLAPHCKGTPQELADYLRNLGFRIKNVVDEQEESWHEPFRWVITTSGVVVYCDGTGLVAKTSR